MARKLGGAVVFLEERYYGKSIPVQQPSQPPFAFLSSVQVIADYALALGFLRRLFNTTRVLAVGGSYGGMLAAWLRKQHPDLVSAALASSAPMVGFASTLLRTHHDGDFFDITESAYPCREVLGAAFRALWASLPTSWAQISLDFGLCKSNSITSHMQLLQGSLASCKKSSATSPL